MRLRDRSAEPSRHSGAASPESEATLKILPVRAVPGLDPGISPDHLDQEKRGASADRDHRHKAGDDVRGCHSGRSKAERGTTLA
jgi:hypothetical protein